MFDEACLEALKELKAQLIVAPIMTVPNWVEPFEIMCDVSEYARQRHEKLCESYSY